MPKNCKILVILTGGTICSFVNNDMENYSNAEKAERVVIEGFRHSNSPYAKTVEFHTRQLSEDVLSENMTIDIWNELLDIFREKNVWEEYDGIIVLHGTDTLAYTSALLSMVLTGTPIPVCMVSSQLDLSKKETNGHINFQKAVELIVNGILPNVYVVYRNIADERNAHGMLGDTFVHYGSRLKQCGVYGNNFYSEGAVKIDNDAVADYAGKKYESDCFLLEKLGRLTPDVVLMRAYTGLVYSRLDLTGVSAVVHETYHSETVCVSNGKSGKKSGYSILSLLERAADKDIPVILSPCDEIAYTYTSTGDALRAGAFGLYGTTVETAYVKTLVGTALGRRGRDLTEFLGKRINYEFAYGKKPFEVQIK